MNIQQFMPVDIHDFTQLRNKNLIFADKSECIFNLARQEQFVFLARPPMFGKSLLVSFLKNYFEGRRELFLGLKIACLEDAAKNPWTVYPVLSFNFTKFRTPANPDDPIVFTAEDEFMEQLREQGERLNFKVEEHDPFLALTSALKQVCAESQKPAVILFDDFLAPAFSSASFSEQSKESIDFLKALTLTVKSAGPNLRFAFFYGQCKPFLHGLLPLQGHKPFSNVQGHLRLYPRRPYPLLCPRNCNAGRNNSRCPANRAQPPLKQLRRLQILSSFKKHPLQPLRPCKAFWRIQMEPLLGKLYL